MQHMHLCFSCPYAAAIWKYVAYLFDMVGSILDFFMQATRVHLNTQSFNLLIVALVTAFNTI